jgi:hypothetical protein
LATAKGVASARADAITRAAAGRGAATEDHRLANSLASALSTEERTGFARVFAATARSVGLGVGPLRPLPQGTSLAAVTTGAATERSWSGIATLSRKGTDHIAGVAHNSALPGAYRSANGPV